MPFPVQVELDAGTVTIAPMQPMEIPGVAVLMARACAPGPEAQSVDDIECAPRLRLKAQGLQREMVLQIEEVALGF